MSPVELVLRVVAVGRPVPARRLPTLARRVVAHVRRAPVSFAYLGILGATTAVIEASSRREADRLLLERSTNLHQLSRDPVRVLVASAFWVDDAAALLVTALLVVLVLAPFEHRVGGLRTTGVFAIGHVGATLLTAAGLWLGIHVGLVEPSLARARDVGASYGCFAVAGALTYLLAPRLRLPYAFVLVGGVAAAAAVRNDFTSVGHLLSVLLGLACFGLVRRNDPAG